MAKIEKPQAIDRLPEIIEASDALMVARGDLGVELPLERVPAGLTLPGGYPFPEECCSGW